MSDLLDIVANINERLAAGRRDLELLQRARDVLAPPAPPRPRLRAVVNGRRHHVVRLPDTRRPMPTTLDHASADDVLALVAAGYERPAPIAARLVETARAAEVRVISVWSRLKDLEREGLVTYNVGQRSWHLTPAGRELNWIPYRVKELTA